MIYTKGSEWHRWDIHIHTPGTLKNDNYSGDTPEAKWNTFYNDIKNYIGDGKDESKAIVGIGITDYLSIKNYKKVISDGILSSIIPFIFPNVELRVFPIAQKTPINLHCIFNPKIADELEGRFFAKLQFSRGTSSYSAIESELKRMGKDIDQTLDEVAAIKLASEQFVISFTELERLFKDDPDLRENCLIAVAQKTADGASGIANPRASNYDSQLEETRTTLYKFSDIIFSGTFSDIQYFLGERSDSKETVCRKYGKLKPCLIGSDAHCNEKIFEPDQKRYCWIKATPSFEGLKEIINEPKDRVRIQELKPEEKPTYYVIDKVIIEDENFSPEPIPFNDKLTCIIGGKSTGKSLLLNNIALTVSPEQVKEKYKLTNPKKEDLPFYMVDSMKVFWKDGIISEKSVSQKDRKIVYIPQTYLNKLSDETEETTEIDTIIQDIILQNEEVRTLFENQASKTSDLKVEIDKAIYDLLRLTAERQKLKNDLAEKGDSVAVTKNLTLLVEKKNKIISENSISEDEISDYETKSKALTKNIEKVGLLLKDKNTIEEMSSLLAKSVLPSFLIEENEKLISQKQEEILSLATEQWNSAKLILLDSISKQIERLTGEIERLKEEISRLQPKIDGNDAIKQLTQEILLETQKLENIQALEKQLEISEKSIEDSIKSISGKTSQFYFIYNEYASKVNSIESLSQDLEFRVEVPFRLEAFRAEILKLIDGRKEGEFFKKISNGQPDFCQGDFDEDYVASIIKLIISSTGKSLLKSKVSIEDFLRIFTSNWYNITYNITLDNDDLTKMSPGKKALVLLKLLINLAESKCPILIDQPEDDLDNRSIYKELVGFIREKKVQRQIILVTHNANIVVGSDSDEVIVANQKGDNSPNREYRFEYRSGAIEDTDCALDENGNPINGILYKTGIQQHICDILEGGKEAFNIRRTKYSTEIR